MLKLFTNFRFQIIQDCWAYAAEDRPDFGVLREVLSSLSWCDLDFGIFAYEE